MENKKDKYHTNIFCKDLCLLPTHIAQCSASNQHDTPSHTGQQPKYTYSLTKERNSQRQFSSGNDHT